MKIAIRILAVTVCILVMIGLSMAQWVKCLDTSPNGISSLATDGSTLYAGRVQKIHVSTDQGLTWVERDIGINSNVFTIFLSGTNVFAGTFQGGAFRSTDKGASWVAINNGIPMPLNCRSFAIVGNTLFGAFQGGGIYRSTDNGANWSAVTNLPISGIAFYHLFVNGTDLYAAGANGTVIVSSNGGVSWNYAPVPSSQIVGGGLAVCDNALFAAAYGGAGVFRSTNKGTTWTPVNTGLTNFAFYGISACGMNLFVGTNAGTFVSANGGASWSPANTGFTDVGSGPFVTTATHIFSASEKGVWKRPLSDFASVTDVQNNVPYEFRLEQNYPNPFNPSTNIEFRVSSFGFVSLKVFDVLGREIATLVNEDLNAGPHVVRWDASGFPSGVYLYKLQAGGSTQTREMVLTK